MKNENEIVTARQEDSPLLTHVPEEILTEILLRLPVKSLLRFRCVSKSWLFLISSYDFAKAHLKISVKNDVYNHDKLIFGSSNFPMDLYTCSLDSLYSLVDNPISPASTVRIYPLTHENSLFDRVWFDCPYADPDGIISLVGSCNGLVCVYVRPSTIFLWNPTTRKSRMLPNSGTDKNVRGGGILYGFGYDEFHDDYKVVESLDFKLNEDGEREIQVKVYSMRTHSWKLLPNSGSSHRVRGVGSFLNGAIHWSKLDYTRKPRVIVSLNLETDTFVELPLPNSDYYFVGEADVLGGCLAFYCNRCVCMDVWVMKEYGVKESWTKVVSIPYFMDLVVSFRWRTKPLFLWKDGKILMNYGKSLWIYDLSNPQNHNSDDSFGVEATTYIESLISPNL